MTMKMTMAEFVGLEKRYRMTKTKKQIRAEAVER